MKAIIEYKLPTHPFWEAYTNLWNHSRSRSVFKSPHYIRFLADRFQDELAVYEFYKSGVLLGASFYRKQGNIYYLLTDIKSDQNYFILHKSCTEQDIVQFFENLFSSIQGGNWAVVLNNQPAWADYRGIFLSTVQKSKLFCVVEGYTKCLILEKENPEALFAELSKSKEAAKKIKRLAQEPNVEFEVFTADEDLRQWTAGFCDLHVRRWQDTGTPSRYQTPASVLFLEGCLKAWSEDGVLVRFSIKLGDERIAYAVCLIQHNALIRHTTTYDISYQKHSPGKILMVMIAQWMKDKGLNKLDFGEGAESYKYDYANTELELDRIFISRHYNIPFILKTRYRVFYRKQVKNNPAIKKAYYEKILPLARKIKLFIGGLSTDFWQINSYLLFLCLMGYPTI
jgi:Acetyltransferase (GNAT) domain